MGCEYEILTNDVGSAAGTSASAGESGIILKAGVFNFKGSINVRVVPDSSSSSGGGSGGDDMWSQAIICNVSGSLTTAASSNNMENTVGDIRFSIAGCLVTSLPDGFETADSDSEPSTVVLNLSRSIGHS